MADEKASEITEHHVIPPRSQLQRVTVNPGQRDGWLIGTMQDGRLIVEIADGKLSSVYPGRIQLLDREEGEER